MKAATASAVENTADHMDEETSFTASATSHPLDPDAEENVSKKARVAGNVLHTRGVDERKSHVNEVA